MSALRKRDPLNIDAVLGPHWRDLKWRLNNLYWIVDEHGKSVRFRLNEEQEFFIDNMHPRMIVLKARQLGMSTLMELLELDQALFNANHTGVVIADTLPNSGKLFGKIEHALKHLPSELLEALPIKSSTARTGIEFEHGSSVHVSTSSRGGTVQLLHVSEFGKIARKYPERAEEIITGAFESVPLDGCIVVESTAEGSAGAFYDLTMPALKRAQEGAPETALDWRLLFFPWYTKATYRLAAEEVASVVVTDEMAKYFREKEAEVGVTFDPAQRAWYVKKRETLGRNIKREFPTTPMEAFEQAVEGAVFGEEMTAVREKGRITVVPLDPEYPVNTFWDFGLGARNPIWLHQRVGLQNRWVKYFDDFGKGLGWWWRRIEEWRRENGEFAWGKHYLPHDAETEILGESVTTKRLILEAAGMRNVHTVPRIGDKQTGIDLMRQKLPADNWFDREGCIEGIKCLDAYQFKWIENMGRYSNEPLGNWASHGADAWMQYAQTNDTFGPVNTSSMAAFKNRRRVTT